MPAQENFPPYSVLMSVYIKETAEHVRACVESLLNQTVPPDEIVVVKDGPLSNELDAELNQLDNAHPGLFTFLGYSENRGLWYALGQGVPACHNELIMRMDTDDVSTSDRAERQLNMFMRHRDLGCVGSWVTEFLGDTKHPVSVCRFPELHEEIVRYGRRRYPLRHPAIMYRKSAVMAARNYQYMPMFEDYDLFMRMASSGCRFYNIQESLVWMRVGEDFFARRGGSYYLRMMWQFKSTCLRRGDMSLVDFLVSAVPQAVVCLLPNRLRAWAYGRMLREPAMMHGFEENDESHG